MRYKELTWRTPVRRATRLRRNARHGVVLPEIGAWYRRLDGGIFEVVALDETAGTIEIQDFDGTLDEIEFSNWITLDIEPVDPPEDYTGALDGADPYPPEKTFQVTDWQEFVDYSD